MALLVYTNDATTTIAAPITAASTSVSVTAGSGSLFPSLSAGQNFIATLIKNGSPGIYEIVLVTASSTDTFTMTRAQENTAALSWNAGDTFALFPTAGSMNRFVQPVTAQAQALNYAADTGAANAYIATLTPALTAHSVGTPIRWKALHANTGASTFNDGAGAAALVISPSVPLFAGAVAAGGIYTSIWDGTEFQLGFSPNKSVAAATSNAFDPITNGYKIHEPDSVTGLQYIEQWGTQTLGAAGNANLNFNFPFPHACLNASATPVGQNTTYYIIGTNTVEITINFGANNSTFMWTAKGY